MNLICFLFGHRPAFGYGNQEGCGYFKVGAAYSDGIGRHHCNLTCECQNCGAIYQVGKIHIPGQYVVGLNYYNKSIYEQGRAEYQKKKEEFLNQKIPKSVV